MEEEQGATIQPEDVPQDLCRGQPWGKDPIDGKRWIYPVNDDSFWTGSVTGLTELNREILD
ncbi:uncharacterized protein G2W53_027046 [Senna tora]|uniref:Uncharacterized protein n=1 Tax=Senna tora TaxID=362788 RepID=A0A834TIK4_9FABA|nr:uncharacterized protein G2W53_027046 [Senna tora]